MIVVYSPGGTRVKNWSYQQVAWDRTSPVRLPAKRKLAL